MTIVFLIADLQLFFRLICLKQLREIANMECLTIPGEAAQARTLKPFW